MSVSSWRWQATLSLLFSEVVRSATLVCLTWLNPRSSIRASICNKSVSNHGCIFLQRRARFLGKYQDLGEILAVTGNHLNVFPPGHFWYKFKLLELKIITEDTHPALGVPAPGEGPRLPHEGVEEYRLPDAHVGGEVDVPVHQ